MALYRSIGISSVYPALLAGVATGLLSTAQAQAQDASAANVNTASMPDEIVVNARRREESLNTVPIAVTAFNAADLDRRDIISTRDLANVTPGLNISQSGNFVPYITIRGQTRGLTGPGTPGVLTYFNDVPLQTTGSLISTFDMGSIQVLKGPQGTLFGRNASGGAVLTYSKPATYKVGAYAQVDYGEYNSLRLQGAVNLPIVTDVLAIRVAGEYTRTDGFTDTTQYSPYRAGNVAQPGMLVPTQRNLDQVTTQGIRATLLFEPTSNISSTTVLDYVKYRGANNSFLSYIAPQGAILPDGTRAAPSIIFLPTSVLNAALGTTIAANIDRLFRCSTGPSCNIIQFAALANQLGPRHAFTDLTPDAQNTLFGISNTTVWDLTDWLRVKNIFGYRRTKTYHNPDVDGTPMSISEVASRSDVEQFTNELQLSGTLVNDRLNYVSGLFYYKTVPSKIYGFSSLNTNNFGGLSNQSTFNYLSERSLAVYGQVDYKLSELLEGLSLTAGYRYTWDKSSGCVAGITYSPFGGEIPGHLDNQITKQQCETNAIPAFSGATRAVTGNFVKKFSQGTYTLGVNWQIDPRTLLYAVTRRGYRSAGFNTPLFPVQYSSIQTFEPETITDVEIGLKTGWTIAGIRGNFTGDIFRGKDKGYQVFQVFSGTGLSSIASGALLNEANLTIQGFEASLNANLFEGFNLGGDVAYTDINVDQVTLDASVAAAFQAAGRTAPSVVVAQQPTWQVNARFDYTIPAEILGGSLTLAADYHHQTSYASSDYRVPGYGVVNAKITLANFMGSPVDVSIYARNLLDKTYFSGPQSAAGGLGVFSYMVAPPRIVGASVRWRLGSDAERR